MQGTVATYDPAGRHATLLLDDGRRVDVPPEAVDASGLRLLRLGQRLRVESDDTGQVVMVTLVTM